MLATQNMELSLVASPYEIPKAIHMYEILTAIQTNEIPTEIAELFQYKMIDILFELE